MSIFIKLSGAAISLKSKLKHCVYCVFPPVVCSMLSQNHKRITCVYLEHCKITEFETKDAVFSNSFLCFVVQGYFVEKSSYWINSTFSAFISTRYVQCFLCLWGFLRNDKGWQGKFVSFLGIFLTKIIDQRGSNINIFLFWWKKHPFGTRLNLVRKFVCANFFL